MISTEIQKGQGLGNQLWYYVVTRVIAKDKGVKFGIVSPENFKCTEFMDLEIGEKVEEKDIRHQYTEKTIIHPLNGSDIRLHDKDLPNIKDGTKIDGLMQDEQYILHRKNEIKEWLKIKKEYDCRDYSDDNICIINFRGTGYVNDIDTYLTKKYWENAVKNMKKINPNFSFVVITEDEKNAKKFFPNYEVHHFNIGKDYAVVKNAKYLILSNSSFAWFPAWLSEDLKYCIAPKYWARHNISDGYWSLGYNITKGWMYQDRNGNLENYDQCLKELKEYIKNNKETFSNTTPFIPSFSKSIKNTVNIFNAFKKETSGPKALYNISKLLAAKAYIKVKTSAWKIIMTVRNIKIPKPIRRSVRKAQYFLECSYKKAKWRLDEYQAKKEWLSPTEIKEYRKKIKIYDAFNFFNELELLEIRLNILDPYVDHFVLVESRMTHAGQPKELFYENNKHLFKKFEKKIIHYVIENPLKDFEDAKKRLSDPNTNEIDKYILSQSSLKKLTDNPSLISFLRDFYEKESVRIPLAGISDNDFCFISDLDEIWNPNLIIDYSKDSIFKPIQYNYVYYLNNRSNEFDGWTGTIGTKYKNIKTNSVNKLRERCNPNHLMLSNGGWHFTFQGGEEMIRNKLESYSHQGGVFHEAKLGTLEKLLNNEDLFGRYYTFWKDESDLPEYILNNKEKYKHLLR